MPLRPGLLIGTSGWNVAEWSGTVFPKIRGKGFHSVEYLSEYCDLVEIEQSFRHPLRPEVVKVWLAKVRHNPRFTFTALLGRQFTYDRCLDDASVAVWKQGFRTLKEAGRLGAVVMQFPWAYKFSQENRDHLIRLRRAFHEFPLVAELRHDSWHLEEAIGTLIDYRIGLVNIDQPQYFRATPPSAILTSVTGYVRLHGRAGVDEMRDFDAGPPVPYLYSPAELMEWEPRINRLASLAPKTLVVFTNRQSGRSMVNALQTIEVMGGGRMQAPPDLLERYYRELAGFRAPRPVQTQLLPEVELLPARAVA